MRAWCQDASFQHSILLWKQHGLCIPVFQDPDGSGFVWCCSGQHTLSNPPTPGPGEFKWGKKGLKFQCTLLTLNSEILWMSLAKLVSVPTPGGSIQPHLFLFLLVNPADKHSAISVILCPNYTILLLSLWKIDLLQVWNQYSSYTSP